MKAYISKLKTGQKVDLSDDETTENTEAVDDKIVESEEAMRNIMEKLIVLGKSKNEMKIERDEFEKIRQEALQKAGISSSMGGQLNADEDAISLVNISDDPSISNCLVYILQKGDNRLGTDPENKFVIKGLGVAEKHAVLTNSDGKHLFIKPLDSESFRVLINGEQIHEKTELHVKILVKNL